MTNINTNKQEVISKEEFKLERANRIAVQTIDNGYRADFYRTHKKIATLMSNETGWEADQDMNKSAQREDFRKFAIEHAVEIGIDWKPQDLRAEENKRIPKYENDDMLISDAIKLIWDNMWQLVQGCNFGVEMSLLTVDTITPISKSSKGADLTKLGIIDGKYEKSGNWAWADIDMTLVLTKDNEEIYYTTTCQLVSGQLKKPHITQTGFNDDIKLSLIEAGLYKEEVKADKKSAKTKSAENTEEVKEEVQAVNVEVNTEEVKPKKNSRKSKKSEKSAE